MSPLSPDTDFEMVIGLEVHAQLKTNTKLFCGCSTQFGNSPNTNTCPVCLGMPGALPVLNKAAVEMAVKAGLALGCDIQKTSEFSRKNYFYPDLPKGYQISQFELPICLGGQLDIQPKAGEKSIGITRIHMEEDAGKLLHQGAEGIADSTHSLVDLNRACTPLIEIVSEPDIRTAEEAKLYVMSLRDILRTIGVCDGNLEEGSMRCDVNISLRPRGQEAFGTRSEIKNVNSFRSIERAIAYEFKRQKKRLLAGEKIVQETRNYHDDTQITTSLRGKEEAHDYRYFPEPDLLPLVISDAFIDQQQQDLAELPAAKRVRYLSELGLSEHDVKVLIEELDMDRYFNACLTAKNAPTAKAICKWIVGDIQALLKTRKDTYATLKLTPDHLAALVSLIEKGTISGKIAKDLLPQLLDSGEHPEKAIEKAGLSQVSNTDDLDPIIEKILAENPDVVEKIRAGKHQSANFLMGQVMKATQGRAKPDLVRELILKKAQ